MKLKKEDLIELGKMKFETIDDLQVAMEEYIKWYNETRINIKRKGMSPLEYRLHSSSSVQCVSV